MRLRHILESAFFSLSTRRVMRLRNGRLGTRPLTEAVEDDMVRRFAPRLALRLVEDERAQSLGLVPESVIRWHDDGFSPDSDHADDARQALIDIVRRVVRNLGERSRAITERTIRWYLEDDDLTLDDLFSTVPEYIRRFRELSRRNLIDRKDINAYRRFRDLTKVVHDAERSSTRGEERREERRRAERESEILYDDGRWLVVIPKTKFASCFWGRGTMWCISATRSENMFERYNKHQGPIWIIIDRSTGHRWAYLEGGCSFWDKDDRKISPYDLPEEAIRIVTDLTLRRHKTRTIFDDGSISILEPKSPQTYCIMEYKRSTRDEDFKNIRFIYDRRKNKMITINLANSIARVGSKWYDINDIDPKYLEILEKYDRENTSCKVLFENNKYTVIELRNNYAARRCRIVPDVIESFLSSHVSKTNNVTIIAYDKNDRNAWVIPFGANIVLDEDGFITKRPMPSDLADVVAGLLPGSPSCRLVAKDDDYHVVHLSSPHALALCPGIMGRRLPDSVRNQALVIVNSNTGDGIVYDLEKKEIPKEELSCLVRNKNEFTKILRALERAVNIPVYSDIVSFNNKYIAIKPSDIETLRFWRIPISDVRIGKDIVILRDVGESGNYDFILFDEQSCTLKYSWGSELNPRSAGKSLISLLSEIIGESFALCRARDLVDKLARDRSPENFIHHVNETFGLGDPEAVIHLLKSDLARRRFDGTTWGELAAVYLAQRQGWLIPKPIQAIMPPAALFIAKEDSGVDHIIRNPELAAKTVRRLGELRETFRKIDVSNPISGKVLAFVIISMMTNQKVPTKTLKAIGSAIGDSMSSDVISSLIKTLYESITTDHKTIMILKSDPDRIFGFLDGLLNKAGDDDMRLISNLRNSIEND